MRIILVLLFLIMTTASTSRFINAQPSSKVKVKIQNIEPKVLIARITYWHPYESGYTYGTKIASNPKGRAIEGDCIAIDNRKIKYGTKVFIPELQGIIGDGYFTANDTGSHVRSLKAIPKAKRSEVQHVIDVFVKDNKTMNKMAKTMPHYMKVYLYE